MIHETSSARRQARSAGPSRDVDRLRREVSLAQPDLRIAPSGSASAPAVTGARRSAAPSTRRTSWPSRRPSANTGAARASPARSSSGRTPTRCRSRPSGRPWKCSRQTASRRDRSRRRLHAHAGDLARDPEATTAAARRVWPTASSSRPRTIRPRTAASSTTRRLADPRTPMSRAGSRTGPTRCCRAASIAWLESRTSAPVGGHDPHARLCRIYVNDLASVVDMDVIRGAGSGSASIRLAAPASDSGRRSPNVTASTSRW